MLILHGGSAALPVVDKLLAAGKVRLVGSSLLLPTIHHFLVRSWIEEQLLLPNAKAMKAFRHVLLWLSGKTADGLYIHVDFGSW
jgi:hypothetical protein